MPKIVGIIGGMGPESTIALMRKVVALTPAQREQEHIRMLVDNRPEIPDRTEFILGNGPSPLPFLQDSARLLSKAGADMIAIACNTAHFFIEKIREVVDVPVPDMLQLLANELKERYPPGAPLGLLATSGSLRIGLFEKYLGNFSLVIPSETVQREWVMEAIYGKQGIKAGGNLEKNRQKLLQALETLKMGNPRCFIAGCTEVGLALEGISPEIPLINPLDILAKEIVSQSLG
jgi:aspartate racemase